MTQHKQSHCIKWHDQHIKCHDMTCHVATNHSSSPHVTSQPSTLVHLTPQATSWHQNRSHHHHGTAEGSFKAKKWFGHRAGRSPCAHSIGKFFLWLVVFFFETSAPGLSGHYLYTNITSLFLQTFHQTTTSSTGHRLPGVLLSGHRFSSTRAPCCNSNSHTSLWPLAAANINGVLPSTSGLFLGARDDRYNRKVGKWKAKWCVFCVKPQKSRHRFFQKMSFDKEEIWYACEVWHRPWKNNFPIGKVTFQGLC